MFIFGVCLMFGLSVIEAGQMAANIGFYIGIVMTALMFLAQNITDGENRIKAAFGVILGGIQIVLMYWFYYAVTDWPLPGIGMLICSDVIHTSCVRALFTKKENK